MPTTTLDWITIEHLHPPLRRLLDHPDPVIASWQSTRMIGGSGDALGVWDISGTATVDDQQREWTIVLKGWSASVSNRSPGSWDHAARESRIYASPLLDHLPDGLTTPAYLGRTERPDGSEWIWLEHIPTTDRGLWPLDRFARAGYLLGCSNGNFLVSGSMPDDPWLSRDWLRQFTERVEPEMHLLDRAPDIPLVKQAFPDHVRRGFWRIWHERHLLYELHQVLPVTICHLDAFRRNMVALDDASDTSIALLDWAYTGYGSIGEDLAPLIGASLYFGEYPADRFHELEHTVIDAYIAGLHDVGWSGDPELVRRGYLSALILRYGVGCAPQMVRVLSGEGQPVTTPGGDMPELSDVAERFAVLNAWLVARSEMLWTELGVSST